MGTAAVKDAGTASGNLMEVGAFGFGGTGGGQFYFTQEQIEGFIKDGVTQVWRNQQETTKYAVRYGSNLFVRCSDSFLNMNVSHSSGGVIFTSGIVTADPSTFKISAAYTTLNTTKSSDGTLKAASPVARIASPDTTIRTDITENDFEWCGYGVANSDAHGIEIIRDDVGVYRVTGAKSLASYGWRLLPPRDPDGSGDLGVVAAEQDDDEIIISLFRRKMVLTDGEIVIQPGEPIDVPVNSWIDIRMDMLEVATPPDSLIE